MFIQHHQFLKHARLPKTVAHFQGPHLQMDEKIARLPKQQLQVPPQSTSNREWFRRLVWKPSGILKNLSEHRPFFLELSEHPGKKRFKEKAVFSSFSCQNGCDMSIDVFLPVLLVWSPLQDAIVENESFAVAPGDHIYGVYSVLSRCSNYQSQCLKN